MFPPVPAIARQLNEDVKLGKDNLNKRNKKITFNISMNK